MSEAAAWGSQLELGALAKCLRQRIDVYSVGLPTVLMGEEFEGALRHGNTLSVVQPGHGSYSVEKGIQETIYTCISAMCSFLKGV